MGGTAPPGPPSHENCPAPSAPLLQHADSSSGTSSSSAGKKGGVRFAPPPPYTSLGTPYTTPPPGAPPSASYPPGAEPPAATFPPGAPPRGSHILIPMYPAPVPGMVVRAPRVPPQPGQVLFGYEVCKPRTGCCCCAGLSFAGIMAVVLLLFFFWPTTLISCVMPECFDSFQRPVFGFPRAPPPGYAPVVATSHPTAASY